MKGNDPSSGEIDDRMGNVYVLVDLQKNARGNSMILDAHKEGSSLCRKFWLVF